MIPTAQPTLKPLNRPFRISWTADADQHLIALHADGMGLRRIAAAIGRSRHAVVERADRLGLRASAPAKRAPAPDPEPDLAREPLRPGHPISWSTITVGTCLEGAPYAGCDQAEAA